MARSPYAIRKGFEYQDLVCCLVLLQYLESSSLDLEFSIESEETEHVDDLVVFESDTHIVGRQVKFHVDQDHAESFDSLLNRKTNKSKSLLEKLYHGWHTLGQSGVADVRIEFISSNPAERGRYKLGPAIETATKRFRDKFFDHADFKRPLGDFKSRLNLEDDELKDFLSHVEWCMSYESIDGLRREIARSLKRLRLPFDEDAVARFEEVIAAIATSHAGRLSLRDLVRKLWSISRFRDACEQRFQSIDFGASQQRRANVIQVGVVSLETLPALNGTRYACLDEPFPFLDYRYGVSAIDKEGLLDRNRESWRHEYADWLIKRVSALLASIASKKLDLLVFPRLSLPLEIAAQVADWCRSNRVHCVVGGHSVPDSDKERSLYESNLNLSIAFIKADKLDTTDMVLDSIIRFDRGGRASTSHFDSPNAKTEAVVTPADSVAIEAADGWITAVVIPSKAIAKAYLDTNPARPELAIVAGGIHSAEAYEELTHNNTLVGTPVLLSCSDITSSSAASILDPHAPAPIHTDGWEGVRMFSILYDRAHSGWEASIQPNGVLPLVYQKDGKVVGKDNFEELRGSHSSRHDAIVSIQTGHQESVIICQAESAAEFFFRRAKEADFAIRENLAGSSPSQISDFTKTLQVIRDSLERLRKDALLPLEFAFPAQVLLPRRSSQFFNRSTEKSECGRFLSPSNNKSVLLLYGASGIGKKELLTEVQRLQPDRNYWIRFRCPPDSRLVETLSQVLVRLGVPAKTLTNIDGAVFKEITDSLAKAGTPVLVLEDAHHLPIARDNQDHNLFLELMAYLCSDTQAKVKLVLVSDWRGHLQFSGSHRLETLSLEGMEDDYIVELLQEHLAETPCRYEHPTVVELGSLASKLHGHPFMARLAAVILEDSTAADVSEKLYARVETRNFVLGRLLSGVALSDKEHRLLEFASILRIPVTSEAFIHFGGPSSKVLLEQLQERFLLVGDEARYGLHPVLSEYFSSGIHSADVSRRLHSYAYDYYHGLSARRSLTVEERNEYIYHGVSSDKSINMADMQMFAGSIRTAINDAVRAKDWPSVENAAKQLLSIWPYDVTGHIAMALALDGSGRQQEAFSYAQSLEQVTHETLWIALEYVKSLSWRRDYDGAEQNLAVIKQRFSDQPRVILAEAQLRERQGETPQAIECCEVILTTPACREGDAFVAGLLLRDAGRLDLLIKHLEVRYEDAGFNHDGLRRLYALAAVTTNHDPHDGLQVLSEVWNAAHSDGYAVSDYAAALIAVGRTNDAEVILHRGKEEVRHRSRGFTSMLETHALLFEMQERFPDAFRLYREAISQSQYHLHLYRAFTRCLLSAAATYRTALMRAEEDSAVAEAKQIVGKLLQMAPLDKWAADALHRVESRVY